MPDYRANALAFTSEGASYGSNMPSQYTDSVQKQYMTARNKAFLKRAKYACDYVGAEIQGLAASGNFYEYTPKKIRLADAEGLTSVSSREADGFKDMLIDDPNVDYVPIGAKVVTMGSTFLVTNPYNLSGALPKCLLTRCNTSYNSYDEYGNVVTEPIYIGKRVMNGSDNETIRANVLPDGYYNVLCQLNDNTRKLGLNQRIIVGSMAYHITGFNDFVQEFSGDRSSVKLLSFTAYIEEPTQYDDVETNFIANGKNYVFGAQIDGSAELRYGLSSVFSAVLTLNGKAQNVPTTWTFTSSDTSVATVYNGLTSATITPVAVGNATITATLNENQNITASIDITVGDGTAGYVEFIGAVPDTIKQYSTVQLEARLYFAGYPPNDAGYVYTCSGAEGCYKAVRGENSPYLYITCLQYSPEPLVVTVNAKSILGTAKTSIQIKLVGI